MDRDFQQPTFFGHGKTPATRSMSAGAVERPCPFCYAARFSVTIGKWRRPRWKLMFICNATPGCPFAKVTGLAQGEPRGQWARGSKRGWRFNGRRR